MSESLSLSLSLSLPSARISNIVGLCVCVRACVRACMRACVRACVCVCVYYDLNSGLFSTLFSLETVTLSFIVVLGGFKFDTIVYMFLTRKRSYYNYCHCVGWGRWRRNWFKFGSIFHVALTRKRSHNTVVLGDLNSIGLLLSTFLWPESGHVMLLLYGI